MSGWIAIKRGLTQHPIFHKRPDRVYVWLWLLETAAYKATRQDAGGRPVEVRRGQVLTSFRQIAEVTGVGVQVIRTLLDVLSNENAISIKSNTGRMLVTICNYEKYQSANGSGNTGPTQRQHTKETREQIPTTSGADAPTDPVKVLFDAGIRILGASGIDGKRARQMIGKWRSAHGDEATIAALGRAQREGAIDPISFVEGCFRFSEVAKAKAAPEIGEVRTFPNGMKKQYAGNGTGWIMVYE